MTEIEKLMAQDAAVAIVTNDELSEISALANTQLRLESEIANVENTLYNLKKSLSQIQEVDLPAAMAAVGMKEFKLSNGGKISIKDDIHASIRKDFLDNAVDWLSKNGLGDIVKDKVEVSFGRGEQADAHKLLLLCKQNGFNAVENLSVHPMTLKATVKEQMSRGVQFPDELFSIHPTTKAVIKFK